MKSKLRSVFSGFSLMEIMVGLIIISLLFTLAMVSFNSLNKKKDLQAESEAVKQDIYLMQSRAVTNLRTQRFVILTNTSYQLEEDTTGLGNWAITTTSRSFKPGVYFYGYTGKDNKLWYETSGLPNFNGQSASPFFSLIYNSTSEKKDLNIDSSGIVSVVTN